MIGNVLGWLSDWTDRMYCRHSRGPRFVWRFWFEVTGQGREARRYMRMLKHGRATLLLRNRTTGAAEAQRTPGGAERSQELTTTDDR